jgi:hypothetical protein
MSTRLNNFPEHMSAYISEKAEERSVSKQGKEEHTMIVIRRALLSVVKTQVEVMMMDMMGWEMWGRSWGGQCVNGEDGDV